MPLSPAEVRRVLRERGIACTAQRVAITQTLFALGDHVGAEELQRAVAGARARISRATVYRTLQLLRDRGLAAEREFGDGLRRYETRAGSHHDHLICLQCGKVTEFEEPSIEALQEHVARRHGFRATRHKLELYGCCQECRLDASSDSSAPGSHRPAPRGKGHQNLTQEEEQR